MSSTVPFNYQTFKEPEIAIKLSRKEFIEYLTNIAEQTNDARLSADEYLFTHKQNQAPISAGEYCFFLEKQLNLFKQMGTIDEIFPSFTFEFVAYIRLLTYFEQLFSLFLQVHKRVKKEEEYPDVVRLDLYPTLYGRYPTFDENHIENFFGGLVKISYKGEIGWDHSARLDQEDEEREEYELELELEEQEKREIEKERKKAEGIVETEEEKEKAAVEEIVEADRSWYELITQEEDEMEETQQENEITLYTLPHSLLAVMEILKKHCFFKSSTLNDIIVIDRPNKRSRFTLIYLFMSTILNTRYTIKTQLKELHPLLSIHHLYASALWSEREVWDIYGITIINHPDIRRLLTDYGFSGYPLRKDFPLTGFYEVNYSDTIKLLEKTRVELAQQYRVFTFSKNWSGGTVSLIEHDLSIAEWNQLDDEDVIHLNK